MEQVFTLGFVWVCVAAYSAGVCGMILRHWAAARMFWTVGAMALFIHAGLAYGVFYQWDHQIALSETAKQTERLMGVSFSAGLYANFLLIIVWVADCALWWGATAGSYAKRPKWQIILVHGFMALMMINGAVIFVEGPRKWLGAILLLVPMVFWVVRSRK
ncbi:MAG: hypothetical protein AAF226_08990 [Verrucomicrobiota bacterium]